MVRWSWTSYYNLPSWWWNTRMVIILSYTYIKQAPKLTYPVICRTMSVHMMMMVVTKICNIMITNIMMLIKICNRFGVSFRNILLALKLLQFFTLSIPIFLKTFEVVLSHTSKIWKLLRLSFPKHQKYENLWGCPFSLSCRVFQFLSVQSFLRLLLMRMDITDVFEKYVKFYVITIIKGR